MNLYGILQIALYDCCFFRLWYWLMLKKRRKNILVNVTILILGFGVLDYTVVEVRPMVREHDLPCCGFGMGWFLWVPSYLIILLHCLNMNEFLFQVFWNSKFIRSYTHKKLRFLSFIRTFGNWLHHSWSTEFRILSTYLVVTDKNPSFL